MTAANFAASSPDRTTARVRLRPTMSSDLDFVVSLEQAQDNATFTLTVTDNQGATANANLTVNVTANTPPTLGAYSNTTINLGSSTMVTPSMAPSDNGSVMKILLGS